MTGRNDQAATLGTNVTVLVDAYRTGFNYPSWFENTLGYAEKGQISAQALQRAANNLLERGEMTKKRGFGEMTPTDRKRETERIIVDYYGDDIANLYADHQSQEARLNAALTHREANQANITANTSKIEELFSGQKNIYDSIGQKADKSHTHAKDGSIDCGLFGLGCAFDDLTKQVGTYALIAGAGVIGFLILRSKI
tara:strand:- start:1826 stop:2416 length:591 start_codon:yes stop_codon:yes gene_type:complete